ncbi:MAG: sulfatase-like hydrolase/transferase [Clostridia bacterium]|nr:sulfatase-like hydrolase/transferase [Clostridia bacterium]
MENILTQIAEAIAAFKPGFSTVYSIWGTVLTVLMFYKNIYIIIGALCTRKFAPAKNFHKYGIVIAARNEKTVIGNLLDSISKQDYPMENVTVFVVADNCTDDGETARIARNHGAVVYERFDKEHATKGFALQFLFQNIEKDYGTDSFEAYIIFDADNLLKSDYISRMNDAFDSGEKIVTSFRNSKNFDENWVSSTYAIHWLRSARQSHRARSVFRLATNIQGTGVLFTNEIVKNGWKYTSLTEDRALTADAVVQGYQITYNDAAEFYDEQPTKIKIALRQRLRWAKGHIMAFQESGWGLFKNIFTYKGKNFWDTVRQRFASYDMFFLVLPRPLFSLLKQIIKGLVFIIAYTISPNFWALTLAYFFNIFAYRVKSWVKSMMVAVYIFVFENKRIKKISLWNKIKFTLTWPIFDFIGKYSMYFALFMKVTWKPIPHDSKVTIDDVSKPKEVSIPPFLKKAGENGLIRFTAHCAFAAVSCAYSFFMLSVKADLFWVFIIVNLVLAGLHLLCDLNSKTPGWLSHVILCLTFVWNITMCCEVLGNGAISYVFSFRLFLNLILYAAPYLLIFAISNSVKLSAGISSVIWFITSSANCFLTALRGRPLFLSDLFSIGTALNVADQYSLPIGLFYVFTGLYILGMLFYFFILEKCHKKGYYKFKWYARYSTCLSILIITTLIMSSTTILSALGVKPYFWSHKVNGFPLNFVMDLQYSKIDEPKGYDTELLENLKHEYSAEKTVINKYDKDARPNVIVIMNESFSDLRVIGDFDTNIDVMPFIDRLCEDESVISGYTYVSVLGGGTANCEYEFLTGDNMFMYSQGAVPYQTNFKNVEYMPGIVSTFNALGYKTVATHPYLASGWNRPNVYSAMGFDVQQYIEDYENPEHYRAYITDECNYDNLIKLYEQKQPDEPLFVFNVTMQNHGGYTTRYKNFEQKVELRNTQGDYPLAEQYLSLLHETDIATEELIHYFEDADEPTVILFFGDHQVQLEDAFYEELYGKSLDDLTEEEMLKKYMTKFFIWSNFDLDTPNGYSDMTALQGRIENALYSDDEGSDTLNSDITSSSDAAVSSDTASSDAELSDTSLSENAGQGGVEEEKENAQKFEPETADSVEKKADKLPRVHDDSTDSDTATDSDASESNITDSDTSASDSAEDETFITQQRVTYPQTVTNLSYLSGLLFESARLPMSPYQRYLTQLRQDFPVITAFGAIDNTGEFRRIDGHKNDADNIRPQLALYEYAVYNHVFDVKNTVEGLFCLTDSDVEITGTSADRFGFEVRKWIEKSNSTDKWLKNTKKMLNDFCSTEDNNIK